MLSLTPFLFGLLACMIDPEKESAQDDSADDTTDNSAELDMDGDGVFATSDCDDANPWVSDGCGRTCTGDIEVTGDDTLSQVAGCAIIEGNLDVEELSQVNLNALNHLEIVTGTLLIMNNPLLESTSGLDNLTNVGGDLLISFNDSLTHLDGLSSLKYIEETLSVSNCEVLTDISGLNGLHEVGSSILLNNIPIENLGAFDQLQVLGASLYISDCPAITSLTDIATSLTSFGNNEDIGTYDEEGYIITSLFYAYNNESLCQNEVEQVIGLFESIGWTGQSNSWENNGQCD